MSFSSINLLHQIMETSINNSINKQNLYQQNPNVIHPLTSLTLIFENQYFPSCHGKIAKVSKLPTHKMPSQPARHVHTLFYQLGYTHTHSIAVIDLWVKSIASILKAQ